MKENDLQSGKVGKKEVNVSNSITEICQRILTSDQISHKLEIQTNVNWDLKSNDISKSYFDIPGRPNNLKFTQDKIKFPKDHEFSHDAAKAKALHFFANHELLAIEVMAKAILELPNSEEEILIKKDIWATLQDEQRHLAIYQERLNLLGFALGDFPVNDYFWKIFSKINNFSSYFALMALTFESANLDFAAFYSKLFTKHGDFASSEVMNKIFNDEVHHVKLGFKYFSGRASVTNVWSSYVSSLPWPVTPARSKGIDFQAQHRRLAGISEEFITQLTSYSDDFRVTERKR